MPCYCDPPSDLEEEVQKTSELVREIDGKTFDHSDPESRMKSDDVILQKNTRKLCKWCKENDDKVASMSLELQLWWRDHQRADAKHKKEQKESERRQRARIKALKKLTSEERKALRV